jgi:hypothetical protein
MGKWLCAAAGALAMGCASSPPPAVGTTRSGGVTRTELSADWNDVASAVGVGLGQVGIAPVRVDRSDPSRAVYTLRTARDEPGELTLERLAEPAAADPVAIAITCSIGRFGDPTREADVIQSVARRLEQLRGVEIAPIKR